jgi:hypothetical protein
MQMLLQTIRHDRQAIVGKALLVLALTGVAAAGFIVFVDTQEVRVEGRLHDVQWAGDPVVAQLDIRVTNKGSENLLVDRVHIVLWADEAKTILLADEEVRGISVPAGAAPVEVSLQLEVFNATSFGAAVWADIDGAWYLGTHRQEYTASRKISVESELERLL